MIETDELQAILEKATWFGSDIWGHVAADGTWHL